MPSLLRWLAVAASLAVVALLAAGCGGGDDSSGTPASQASTTAGDVGRYRADALTAARSLQSVGRVLRASSTLAEFQAKVPQVQRELGRFDQVVRRMAGYRLELPALEAQRAALTRTAPRFSSLLRQFVQAARRRDLSRVRALRPQLQSALRNLTAAVET
jgi:hypothetical protein